MIITPHFVSPAVTATGGKLSNGVASMAGILLRIVNSIFESHQRQADRDIARFLARSGGRLTISNAK